MEKPKVFVSRRIPVDGLDRIIELGDVELWEEDLEPSYDVLLEKVVGADGLVCLLTDRIDDQLMDAAGDQLRVISQMAVGFDNIDTKAATERGIAVGHTPGVLTDTTADFAFTLLMAAARRVAEGARYVQEGHWKTWGPTLLMGYDVYGSTLGLVGSGRIGQAVARRASGFNMRILCYDPFVDEDVITAFGAESTSLENVLSESDFVSLHVPLTRETRHMIGASQFRDMKSTCVLVNTSRGPVVDTEALYHALKDGEIAYAALEVTEPEPIPFGDPILTLDNCLIVPHIASSSIATRTQMSTMVADNLAAGLKGEVLPYCANPEIYG